MALCPNCNRYEFTGAGRLMWCKECGYLADFSEYAGYWAVAEEKRIKAGRKLPPDRRVT